MMRDLNQMMRDKLSGREPDFDGFMDKWGQMFGPNPPQSFDELMEMLQQQLAQMQSMLDSMSPEARQEMEDALAQALRRRDPAGNGAVRSDDGTTDANGRPAAAVPLPGR